MMPNVFEDHDIKSHGLELIVQKQGALLLKEFVNYTSFMTKTAETLPCVATYISHTREYLPAPSLG